MKPSLLPLALPRLAVAAAFALAALSLSGCLTAPVATSGGIGALTVPNTNPTAIIAAANAVFPQSGYSMGPVDYPDSVSFDKPAGGFGNLLYGSYGVTTSVRATLVLTPIGGSNDYHYRVSTRVSRVSDAGEAGFEDSVPMSGLWAGEFLPLLRQVSAQAANAGPM